MTVSTTSNRISYNCNGSQTVFPYNFKIFNDEDLTVILRGVDGNETTLALTTDYSVSGAGEESGGNVTTVQTYASGNTLVIVRELDLKQETDYQEGGSFPAEAHENVVDRLTMIAQQLLEQLGRAIKLPISSQYSDLELPDPDALKVLRWNSVGTRLENAVVSSIIGAFEELTNTPSSLNSGEIYFCEDGVNLKALSFSSGSVLFSSDGKVLSNKLFKLINLSDVNISSLTDGKVLGVSGGKVVQQDPASGGTIAQIVNTQTGAVATGTTVMPADDTIPQKTEGDEYMTLAITPTSATNKLKIDVVLSLTGSVADYVSAALFQDDNADAIAASYFFNEGNGHNHNIKFTHYMTAGTTDEITFKVRAGLNSAGTTTFNGNSGSRRFGGVLASSITITEIEV